MKRTPPLLCLAGLLAACSSTDEPAPLALRETAMPTDVHSNARPAEVRVTHLDLDLDADFSRRTLAGTATYALARSGTADPLVLDTDGLEIAAVTDGRGAPLAFELGPDDPVKGRALSIALRQDTERVAVRYTTRPDAAALQWLSPEQARGAAPFLFTQGQAILTRTWMPCQDTPAVRMTYAARVTVPDGLRAVMSAATPSTDGEPAGPGRAAFRFEMTRPIPSYLVALAIGELEFRALGERTGVYAQPFLAEAAAYEFADTESMMAAAERLYGPYRWGRYDLLVLPPSFPFGGMENPCLTFLTPTVIAGDRSLVALIAHELAHSWSGNLVTNATWSDFWLNEGFTVYFERRIMEEIAGKPYVDMLRVLGWQDLQEDLTELRNGPDTKLHVDLAGRNPDDAFSDVPYEKGALFLTAVENAVGRARFDAFLRDYFERFAFQSMTGARFLEHMREGLFAADAQGYARLGVDEWIHGTGLPASAPKPASNALAQVAAQCSTFAGGADPSRIDTAGWTTHHWVHFLRGLPPSLPAERLAALDRAFGFTDTGNSEILFEWLRIAVRNRFEPALPRLADFLTRQGRRKFLKPLYQDLVRTDWGLAEAERIYRTARPTYHSVSADTLDGILAEARAAAAGGGAAR